MGGRAIEAHSGGGFGGGAFGGLVRGPIRDPPPPLLGSGGPQYEVELLGLVQGVLEAHQPTHAPSAAAVPAVPAAAA